MNTYTLKCPKCSGNLIFNEEQQFFFCEYCDSHFDKNDILEKSQKINLENKTEQKAVVTDKGASKRKKAALKKEFEKSEYAELNKFSFATKAFDNVKVYSCKECGAEIISDEITITTTCPYCDNPVVFLPQVSGGIKPDYIIPFKISKEEATKILNNFCATKYLVPKQFKDEKIIENIKGVYLPFWLYNCSCYANAIFEGTKIAKNEDESSKHYKINKRLYADFKRFPVDASKQIDNDYTESIEPFDFSEMIPFNIAYLSGFNAEKFDETIHKFLPDIKECVTESLLSKAQKTITDYDFVKIVDYNSKMTTRNLKYALLPVWILSVKQKNKDYLFIINGQTGKIAGKLPIDKKKYWFSLIGIITAIVGTAQFFILR